MNISGCDKAKTFQCAECTFKTAECYKMLVHIRQEHAKKIERDDSDSSTNSL